MSENEAPEGYRYEWVPDKSWQIGGDGRHCRMKKCIEPAVARLWRTYRYPARGQWWAYCGNHLYGRRIVDNVVEFRRLVAERDSNG